MAKSKERKLIDAEHENYTTFREANRAGQNVNITDYRREANQLIGTIAKYPSAAYGRYTDQVKNRYTAAGGGAGLIAGTGSALALAKHVKNPKARAAIIGGGAIAGAFSGRVISKKPANAEAYKKLQFINSLATNPIKRETVARSQYYNDVRQ